MHEEILQFEVPVDNMTGMEKLDNFGHLHENNSGLIFTEASISGHSLVQLASFTVAFDR